MAAHELRQVLLPGAGVQAHPSEHERRAQTMGGHSRERLFPLLELLRAELEVLDEILVSELASLEGDEEWKHASGKERREVLLGRLRDEVAECRQDDPEDLLLRGRLGDLEENGDEVELAVKCVACGTEVGVSGRVLSGVPGTSIHRSIPSAIVGSNESSQKQKPAW